MKRPKASVKTGIRPSATTPSKAPVTDGVNRRSAHRRNVLLLVAVPVLLVLFAFTRREALRERWLDGQPIDRLRDLDQRHDADALVHYLYARRLVDTGAGAAAVAPITRAVDTLVPSTSPDLAGRVLALAGYVAAQTGQNRQAEERLQQAATLHPNDPLVYLGLGIMSIHTNRLTDAVAALNAATRLAPARVEAWRRLGSAYVLGAEPAKAVEAFRHAVVLTPRDPQVHAELAQALRGSKRYSESAAECRSAADLAPRDSEYAALPAIDAANAARTDAEYVQAARLLRDALDLRPQDGHLRGVLACLDLRFGEWAAARKELETLLANNPENAIGWDNLAVACARMGDRAAAASASARYSHMVDIVIETTELKKQALLHRSDPAAFLRLAAVCRRAGKYRDAAVALEQAQRLRPDDPQIARDLSAMQAAMQRTDAPGLQYPEGAEQN